MKIAFIVMCFIALIAGAMDYDAGARRVCAEAEEYKADIRLLTCEPYYKETKHDSHQAD